MISKPKKITAIFFFLIMIFLLASCANANIINNNSNIKESNLNHSDSIDKDLYKESLDSLIHDLVYNKGILKKYIEIEDLDQNNIPELVAFRERDIEDKDDQGSLLVYKFIDNDYILIDSVDMNFDNYNYQIEIGYIAKDQIGIYLNNHVGAHAGMTYGYILEDNKLKSILNEKKSNLISVFPKNEIKDIDGDGILEFSIYSIDPESKNTSIEDSDKIKIWYRWDGKDSVTMVDIQKHPNSDNMATRNSNNTRSIIKTASEIIQDNNTDFLNYLNINKNNLSKEENTILLKKYIKKLNKNLDKNNNSIIQLSDKYHIQIDDKMINHLNSKESINSLKELEDKDELKEYLIDNINSGFYLKLEDGKPVYNIDYSIINRNFKNNILQEFLDYIQIINLDPSNIKGNENYLDICVKKLIAIEQFINIYPYSEYIPQLNNIYFDTIDIYIFGIENNPHFNKDNNTIDKNVLKHFESTIDQYEKTHLKNILSELLFDIKNNNNKLSKDIQDNIKNYINSN